VDSMTVFSDERKAKKLGWWTITLFNCDKFNLLRRMALHLLNMG
jgi:hypothetical protein